MREGINKWKYYLWSDLLFSFLVSSRSSSESELSSHSVFDSSSFSFWESQPPKISKDILGIDLRWCCTKWFKIGWMIIFDVLLIYLKPFEWQLGQQLFVASFDFVFCSIALQVSLPDKDGISLDMMELKENVTYYDSVFDTL